MKSMDKRDQTFLIFAQAFNYPAPEFWGNEGKVSLILGSTPEFSPKDFSSPGFLEHLEADYIRYFEVGEKATPPCPLYEGLHRKDEDRASIIMDLLRFYHFFDLRLNHSNRDYPDHLSTELEFMGYLTSREAGAGVGSKAKSFQLAQRDFQRRHLGRWLPLLQSRLDQHMKNSIYNEVCSALIQFMRREQDRLAVCLDGGDDES